MATTNTVLYGYRLAVQTAAARSIIKKTFDTVAGITQNPVMANEILFQTAKQKQAQKLANEAKPAVGIPFDPQELKPTPSPFKP